VTQSNNEVVRQFCDSFALRKPSFFGNYLPKKDYQIQLSISSKDRGLCLDETPVTAGHVSLIRISNSVSRSLRRAGGCPLNVARGDRSPAAVSATVSKGGDRSGTRKMVHVWHGSTVLRASVTLPRRAGRSISREACSLNPSFALLPNKPGEARPAEI